MEGKGSVDGKNKEPWEGGGAIWEELGLEGAPVQVGGGVVSQLSFSDVISFAGL